MTIPKIGFTCAYTPLALIEAAGGAPHRILPVSSSPEHAGQVLHDNLCPHAKCVLDLALNRQIPELAAMVVMNSCDAMRRLADAWRDRVPEVPVLLVDLPASVDEHAANLLAEQLEGLARDLSGILGQPFSPGELLACSERYNQLARLTDEIGGCVEQGRAPLTRQQALFNSISTQPVDQSLLEARELLSSIEGAPRDEGGGVPIFLFGNMLHSTEALELFESCGARVARDDLCTGSRLLGEIELPQEGPPWVEYARGLLARPACARTMHAGNHNSAAERILAGARACGARGVVGHILKFCDPYLARVPAIRQTLREEALPLLVLEGDCTLRSIGQQRTRVEAFVEMLR